MLQQKIWKKLRTNFSKSAVRGTSNAKVMLNPNPGTPILSDKITLSKKKNVIGFDTHFDNRTIFCRIFFEVSIEN